MTKPTCSEVRDAAAEYALGILPPAERSAVAAHLLRCPACREEVEQMLDVGSRLLDLVPGTEPPLGFDRRVLARAGAAGRQRSGWHRLRSPRPVALVSLAAAAAVVFGTIGWVAGRGSSHTPHPAAVAAQLRDGTRVVGEVEAYHGRLPWVSMTVHGVSARGWVVCELIDGHGRVTRIGSFPLVAGGGTWSAPEPNGPGDPTAARLLDAQGRVVASATFT